MTWNKLFRPGRVALALLGGVLCAGAAHAQFRTSLQGTVTDPQGDVVPGATLTLTDLQTKETTVRTSSDAGVFNFSALPADHFTLTVERSGFQKKVLNNLEFIPEQANSLTVQMAVGNVSETVNVDASTAPALDTETSNIGATVTSNEIQHLPSSNRDPFTLTQLTPGAVSDGSQGSGGGVYGYPGNQGPGGSGNSGQAPTENGPQANANGQAYETNGISIDGISTVSAVWGGTTVITPSEESIDNIRVVTNDYDAENGRFSGAQTMVTSKSGTNQLHGSAFIAIYRPGLNAKNRNDGVLSIPQTRDTSRYNQYGGSLGGPIWRDKIFAFFAYEASPFSSPATGTGWYDTSAFDALGPSGSISSKFLTFPGAAVANTGLVPNVTCATAGLTEGVNCHAVTGGLNIGSPLTSPLGTHDPHEGGTPLTRGIGSGLSNVADIAEYYTSNPTIKYYRQYNGRLDGQATKNDHLSFVIYWVPQGTTDYNGGTRPYNLFHHNQINDAFSVIWNHTFSPTWVNEARANAAGWRWNEIADNPQQPVGLPQDSVLQVGSVTLNQFGSALGSDLNQWTYGYKDVATKVAGRHTIKFGGEYTNLHYLNNPVGRPNYSFYNVWDFLNDAPEEESGDFNPVTGFPGGNRQDDRENLFGFFVQDDWKFRPNLTLHAGLRYSYFGSLYTKQNNLSAIRFGTGSSLYTGIHVQVGGNLYTPQKGNFGPEVGFNWSPTGFHNKLVVRGGYGLNFNQEEIALTANSGNNPPTQSYYNFQYTSPGVPGPNGADIVYGVSSSPTSLNGFASNPHTITTFTTNGLPTAGNANITAFGNYTGGAPTPYAQHYSLDAEYELIRDVVVSLGYQGSHSSNLINHETPNAPAVVMGVPLNPLIVGGDYWTNQGYGTNNALLAEVKHPFSRHFSADAQFLWSKSLDTDGSGPYYEDEYFPLNPAFSYGRSEFDVEKSFKAYGLWQPVIFHGSHGWMEKIVGGWSLSGIFQAHTGFPWTPNYPLGASLYCSNCGYYNVRPKYLGGARRSGKNSTYFALPNTPASNFPTLGAGTGGGNAYGNNYFVVPDQTAAVTPVGGGFPNANVALPTWTGADRNSFSGPSYKDVDATLAKSFGLPNNRLLGEHSNLELRADFFNLFNILNLNPQSVSTNINASNFGQDLSPLAGRIIDIQARFSF